MSRRPINILGGLVAALCVAAAVIAIARPGASPARPGEAAAPDARDVLLMFSGDTHGWIVPCGCTSNQSGGLLRRGSAIADRRRTADVLYMDVGGAPAGDSAYEIARFTAILRGERALEIAAHNLGGPEIRLGPNVIRQLASELKAPFLSANAHDTDDQPLAPSHVTVTIGNRRIVIVGVVSPQFATSAVRISDPQAAVLSVSQQVQPRPDALVVLAYLPEAELRSFARSLPEADVIMGGPTGQSIPPTRSGPGWLASATNKGKFVVEIRVPPASRSAAEWSGRSIELTADIPDDATQLANLRAYRDELARLDLPAAESGFAPAEAFGTRGNFGIAGSDACRDCHVGEFESWHASRHAHGWESLARDDSQVDSYCQQCHSTGFGWPGGFVSARRSIDRTGVGCESCHGPSLAHIADTSVAPPFAAADACLTCHDPENSPEFAYDRYWKQIEHGRRAATSAAARVQERINAL